MTILTNSFASFRGFGKRLSERRITRARVYTPGLTELEGRTLLATTSLTGATIRTVTETAFVEGLYTNVLNRSAETAGETFWLGVLNRGINPNLVTKSFLNSTEYQALHGSAGGNISNSALTGVSRKALVDGLYADVLLRQPDTSGETFWINALNEGVSPSQVTQSFLTSTEYQTLSATTPAITVSGFTATASTTGTTTADFVVNLSAISTSTVSVNYATSDGTAVAGTDYTATSGTLTFAPGVTKRTIPVTILAHTGASASKTLTLTLSNPTNATLSTTTAVGTINS